MLIRSTHGAGQLELEHTQQTQPHRKDDARHHDVKSVVLEQLSQSDSGKRGQRPQTQKHHNHADGIGQIQSKDPRPALTRLLNKREDLDRDHRQHTGHDVHDHAAEECQNQCIAQRERRPRFDDFNLSDWLHRGSLSGLRLPEIWNGAGVGFSGPAGFELILMRCTSRPADEHVVLALDDRRGSPLNPITPQERHFPKVLLQIQARKVWILGHLRWMIRHELLIDRLNRIHIVDRDLGVLAKPFDWVEAVGIRPLLQLHVNGQHSCVGLTSQWGPGDRYFRIAVAPFELTGPRLLGRRFHQIEIKSGNCRSCFIRRRGQFGDICLLRPQLSHQNSERQQQYTAQPQPLRRKFRPHMMSIHCPKHA